MSAAPISDFWPHPAVIARNHFVHKSLSCWSLNIAVGCPHGCRFCYVPEASTIKLGKALAAFGVTDPDAQWGDYALLRRWDEQAFLSSLRKAEATPREELNADGNRAVMLCTTTDPYFVMRHENPDRQKHLNMLRTGMLGRALEIIRDHSTLNVRILTRSPLARLDFDLMQSFGNRLLFGMSLPTLDDRLARIYEPNAPAPSQRLKTLQAAKAAGIPIYVAMAPTYPECTPEDLRATLAAIAALDPVTIFHEPINIRAENVARIAQHAAEMGVALKTETWASRGSWASYALAQLAKVQQIAKDIGCHDCLHLWPDKTLGRHAAEMPALKMCFEHWWNRISAWPQ